MWLPGLDKEQALAVLMVRQNLIGLLPEFTTHTLGPFFWYSRKVRLDRVIAECMTVFF